MTDDANHIRELLRDGKNREAAKLLLDRGELKPAMEAYAAVWDYARAAEVALTATDRPRALDYLLRGGDRAAAVRIRAEIAVGTDQEASRAVDLLLARGEKDEASRLLEARGDLRQAAELAQSMGQIRRAAALLERGGELREAGRLYERLVREHPDDGEAALALGVIFRHFGRNEPAAKMLQKAAQDPRLRRPALRSLAVALHGLGLREAAQVALEQYLAEDASGPRSVEALVAAEASSQPETEGQWIAGRYQVLEVLGGGAAGRVYLARDTLYEREVALKVFSATRGAAGGRDAFSRFAREAHVAARLDHPNIVRILDFDETAGFLAMEHAEGGTLGERLGSGPVPLVVAEQVLMSVLAGLEVAHLRGVVHRDIKPANILFGAAGEVKLTDFGVAHLQDLGLTQTGAFIGTLAYMAPEQITGDRISAATDLYGLGTTLFHAVCGRPPFIGTDLVTQHLAEPPPKPGEIRPGLGDRFDAFFDRLLAKTANGRFARAADVREAARLLDFSEPKDEAKPTGPVPLAPVAIPEDESGPYELKPGTIKVLGGRGKQGRHRTIDRAIVMVQVMDEELKGRLLACSKVVSPFVQCVLDVDEESQQVVLEAPRGQSLSETLQQAGPLPVARALQVTGHVLQALSSLSDAGQGYGPFGAEQVHISRGRTLLLLGADQIRNTSGSLDSEARAKDAVALLAACLGVDGDLAGLLEAGPLAERLGDKRSATIRAGLPEPLDLECLARAIDRIREALDDRSMAKEHLHALAATARAEGANPRKGPMAAFLERRRTELDA